MISGNADLYEKQPVTPEVLSNLALSRVSA